MKLLNVNRNAKTVKNGKLGHLTGVLYLAPARLSGYEVCPSRSPGCTEACLNTAGRGAFDKTQQARIRKTKWYFEDRDAFMAQLDREIASLVAKAKREGLTPSVRLNGTSDIPWERIMLGGDIVRAQYRREHGKPNDVPLVEGVNLMQAFPSVQFYDYTKIMKRAVAYGEGRMPANYHLTFSLTEDNDAEAMAVLRAGGTVAAVFRELPTYMHADRGRLCWGRGDEIGQHPVAWPVIDGDEHDGRFSDMKGVVVGLMAKGKARHDASGFVR